MQVGLEIGKQKLLGNDLTATVDTQVATEWQDYVTLGQWTVLLWVVCETKPTLPKSFWDTQQKIVATLQTGFRTRPATDEYAKIMLPHLEQIAKELSMVVPVSPNYVPLKAVIEVMMKVRW